MKTLLTIDDGAQEMVEKRIDNPLTDAEKTELLQQLNIALLLVNSYTRPPDDLIKALGILERRFFATADEARLFRAVKDAEDAGFPRSRDRTESAFDVAAAELGKYPPKGKPALTARAVEERFYEIEKKGRAPLANTPKRK